MLFNEVGPLYKRNDNSVDSPGGGILMHVVLLRRDSKKLLPTGQHDGTRSRSNGRHPVVESYINESFSKTISLAHRPTVADRDRATGVEMTVLRSRPYQACSARFVVPASSQASHRRPIERVELPMSRFRRSTFMVG